MAVLSKLWPLMLLLAMAGCGGGTEEPAPVEAQPALWEISDADTTVYLFGTYALVPERVSWFDGPVREAFEASDQLVVDTVPSQNANRRIEALAAAQDGRPLSDKLSPEDNRRFDALIERFDIDRAAIEGADPWFAVLTLSLLENRAIGLRDEDNAEIALIRAAANAGMFVVKRESYADRLEFFERLDPDVQATWLAATIGRFETLREDHPALLEDWIAGDIEGFAAGAQQRFADRPQLRDILLTDRNGAWADWIVQRLDRPGTVFVAVEAERLGGADSIPSMLAERDIRAERLR